MAVTRVKPIFDDRGKMRGYEDIYTGEQFGLPVLVGRKDSPYANGWYMGNQELAREIFAKDKDIKSETHRVLWFIISILDFENWVQLSITEIANELGMRQPNVSKAIKVLENKEVIIRGPKVGRSFSFRFNPEFGWKGKVKNLDHYRKQKEDEENQQQNQERYEKNLELVELSKKDQLIMAIKKGEIDIEKYYQLMTKDQKSNDND
jgi:DNA-binding transcriptional regulator GbsR (MarR family)